MVKKEIDLQNPKLNWFLGNGQAVMLTCCNAQRSINGIITLTWITPTSHVPFLITASVGNGGKEKNPDAYRACHSLIDETKEFGLNIPTIELMEAVAKVGTTHSDEVDKFTEAGLTLMESKMIGAPLVSECFLNCECKVIQQFVTGDHTVFVAEPVAAYIDDDVLVEDKFAQKYCDKSTRIYLGDVITMWNMW